MMRLPNPKRDCAPMFRFSIPYFVSFFQRIERIETMGSGPLRVKEVVDILFPAQLSLLALFGPESVFEPHLSASLSSANRLFSNIKEWTDQLDSDVEMTELDVTALKRSYQNFHATLVSNLDDLGTFLVLPKSPFDTSALLNKGETLFPTDLVRKVPEAVPDVQAAARCLAFEAPTACGYHIFRAVESVLRRYYAYVTGGSSKLKSRNIAVYVNAMQQAKRGSPKILSALKQMSDLHRNPLAHPDVMLDIEEAVNTVGLARSIASAMLAELPIVNQIAPVTAITESSTQVESVT